MENGLRVWGLRLTAVATVLAGLIALIGSANAPVQEAPTSGFPLAIAGVALLVVAALMATSKRPDLVQLLLAGLAAGAFGIVLAEIEALTAITPDHYGSLWIPIALGGLLVAFRAFDQGDSRGARRLPQRAEPIRDTTDVAVRAATPSSVTTRRPKKTSAGAKRSPDR
jgi:hypothetical protein